jgi:hypothetical protein
MSIRCALLMLGVGAVWVAGPAIAAEPGAGMASTETPAAVATEAAADQEKPADPPPPPAMELTLGGFYQFDGYTQNNFFLGRRASGLLSDRDDYMIQLFRLQPVISYGTGVRGILRIDLAQKIFGLDNEQRDTFRPGFSNLFNNKDTHFLVHLDWAYIELAPPQFGGWMARLGRMKNQVGHLLVVDQNGDGVQAVKAFAGGKTSMTANWTKMWEGVDGLTDDRFEGLDGRDADLFYVEVQHKAGGFTLMPYLVFYSDRGHTDDRSYIPNYLQYNKPRFTPNINQAAALGFAWNGAHKGIDFRGEAVVLTGKDKIANVNSGPNQLLDVNNGDLSGYTFYADVKVPAGKGKVGGILGLGSGDKDPMSGKGNITKIRTLGHFYVTEIWEDSIMPDEEGITPQGLGSPASRGYREFENTTLLQLNYNLPVNRQWRVFTAASLIRATEALRPWRDVNGNGVIEPGEFGTESSRDLGKELDFMIDWTLMPNVVWTLRGGYMWAGDAAGYLINGTNQFKTNPWELRTTVRFNFAGLKLK